MTPEQRDAILESIAAGVDLDRACRAAGISRRRWDERVREHADLERMVRDAEERNRARIAAAEEAAQEERRREDEARRRAQEAIAPKPVDTAAADRFAEAKRASAEREREEREEAPPAKRARGPAIDQDGRVDWQRIHEEARDLAPGPFGYVLWQERALASACENFPPLSPFSLHTIARFFGLDKRWLLLMAGRGFGKSTLTSRLATVLGLFTARKMSPGPAWVCPMVSVLPVDAERRLEDVREIMRGAYHLDVKIALGKSTIATKDASDNPIAWVSSASTIGNVSGPSSFAALVDEEEKILRGQAGAIVGSLAYTFRSRPGVRGLRVSSAMATTDTLATDCRKGETITNYVATLGPFLLDAVDGLLAVADWEERGDDANRRPPNPDAANAIRAHAATLTEDSWQIPTWLGHPSIGNPDERPVWTPRDAAIATRTEAEAVPDAAREGLPPWRYWLRECASVPTGGEAFDDGEAPYEVTGEPSRYYDETPDVRAYEEHAR